MASRSPLHLVFFSHCHFALMLLLPSLYSIASVYIFSLTFTQIDNAEKSKTSLCFKGGTDNNHKKTQFYKSAE